MTSVPQASADEGVPGFLSALFGGGIETPSAPQQPSTVSGAAPEAPRGPRVRHSARPAALSTRSRPLVVRLHTAPRLVIAQSPIKPERVSILEDRTLRSGDMIMTKEGIRVFEGAPSTAHRPADFVSLSTAKTIGATTIKQVSALDRLPRI
ncbi:MAG: hypothetical protein ACRYF1_16785 [Janthinobacterium lividum]